METNALLETHLRQLRLPAFKQNYASFAEDASRNNHDHVRYLLALVEVEVAQREQNRISRRTKAAKFPALKELADFEFSAIPKLDKARVLDLARGEYINKRESILLVGNPGLGKTHLAIAPALAACRQGLKVRFWTAAGLANELLMAQGELRLHRFIAAALKLKLVVLDELGFIPFAPDEAHALFTFCSELYERAAMIVTTNLNFADWTQIFGEEKLAAALLDRLTHHAHILELVGEPYRFRQRMAEEAG